MDLRIGTEEEFENIRDFYWELIDKLKGRTDTSEWKKGIYPTDEFIKDSIGRGELYLLDGEDGYLACVVLNSDCNEGYDGLQWGVDCENEEVIVPHILAVNPDVHRNGIGKKVVKEIIELAAADGKKTIRLDVLKGNIGAEKLYSSMGFNSVEEKVMYYEDTGWTDFIMYEYIL